MTNIPTPDPTRAMPSALPEYAATPNLGAHSDGGMRSTDWPEGQVWVGNRAKADDREYGDEFAWVMFNKFDVDFATPTNTEWRPTGTATGKFRTVPAGEGMCQQQQEVNQEEWSFSHGILLQYYEQWITDTALETYYDAITHPVSKGASLVGAIAGKFGALQYAAGAAAIESGAMGTGATIGAGAAAGGTVAGLATLVGTFVLTTSIMRDIVNERRVGATGWQPIGKFKTEEKATGKTRTAYVNVGDPYPCPKAAAVPGGTATKVSMGSPSADPPRSSRPPWWVWLGGAGVVAAVAVLIAVVSGGGDTPTDRAATPTDVASTVAVDPTAPPATTTAPASTALPAVPDPTAPPSTVPPSTVSPSTVPPVPDPATVFGFANPCGEVGHSSPEGSNSPSFVRASGVVYGVDGPLDDGTVVTFFPNGADIEMVDVTAGPGGLITDVIFPISSFGDYLVVIEIGGQEAQLDEPFRVSVGAAEGPVGGCTPAGNLPPEQLDEISSRWIGSVPDVSDVPVIPAPEDDLGPYRDFFTRFESAHGAVDTDFLFTTLHPAVIDRYGPDQCMAYVESVAGTVSDMRVASGRTEPWDFPLDDRSTDIAGSVTLVIEANWDGELLAPDVHVAPIGDGIAWFADCGDPL